MRDQIRMAQGRNNRNEHALGGERLSVRKILHSSSLSHRPPTTKLRIHRELRFCKYRGYWYYVVVLAQTRCAKKLSSRARRRAHRRLRGRAIRIQLACSRLRPMLENAKPLELNGTIRTIRAVTRTMSAFRVTRSVFESPQRSSRPHPTSTRKHVRTHQHNRTHARAPCVRA
jgi:hypothetical protein